MVQVNELSCASRGLKNIIVVIVIIIQTGVENKNYWSLQVIFLCSMGTERQSNRKRTSKPGSDFPLLFKADRAVPFETGLYGNVEWRLIHPNSISQADSLQLGGMNL